MLFASFDIAPESGDYRVFGADGTPLGILCVRKNDVLPPCMSALDYFESPPSPL